MSQNSKPKSKKTSTCNCGQVEVAVTGVDKGAVICHCINCQRASGSAFAHNHRMASAEIEVVKGKDVIKEYEDPNTKSGNVLRRHFCGNCGCPLYLTNDAFSNFAVLSSGCIKGERSQPKFDVFPENKYSWVGELTSSAKKL